MSRRSRRTERGSAVVEFALVFPVVVLIVLGIIQYSYQYWALQTAAATAREAARSLIVGTDEACVLARARRHAGQPALGPGEPAVTVTYDNATNTPVRGTMVQVTVSFQSLDLGLLPVPDAGRVTQTATNRVENVPLDPLPCAD